MRKTTILGLAGAWLPAWHSTAVVRVPLETSGFGVTRPHYAVLHHEVSISKQRHFWLFYGAFAIFLGVLSFFGFRIELLVYQHA